MQNWQVSQKVMKVLHPIDPPLILKENDAPSTGAHSQCLSLAFLFSTSFHLLILTLYPLLKNPEESTTVHASTPTLTVKISPGNNFYDINKKNAENAIQKKPIPSFKNTHQTLKATDLSKSTEKSNNKIPEKNAPAIEIKKKRVIPAEKTPPENLGKRQNLPHNNSSNEANSPYNKVFDPRLRKKARLGLSSKRKQNNKYETYTSGSTNYDEVGKGKCIRENSSAYGIEDRDSEEHYLMNIKKSDCPGTRGEGEIMIGNLRSKLSQKDYD